MITQRERLQAIEHQLQRLQRRIEKLDQQSNRYGWIRVGIFFFALLLSVSLGFLINWWIGVLCFLPPIAIFSIVAYYQRQINRSLVRHQIWQHIKVTEIARMRRDWRAIPDTHITTQSIDHPFATDLDIVGKHSIHQLINTAISADGTERLSKWLLATKPDLETIKQRQALLQELKPLSAFRTRFTMMALLARKSATHPLESQRLLHWLDKQPEAAKFTPFIIASHALTVVLLLLLLLNLFGLIPQYWVIALIAILVFVMMTKEKRGNLFEDSYYLRDAFAQIHPVLSYLETYRYGQNKHLRQLCQPYFATPHSRPSLLLKKLQAIASKATLERNMLVWLLLNLLIPWDFYLARQFQHYRDLLAAQLPVWLDTWFELEALHSLATFAYLHPEYIQPDVRETTSDAQPEPFASSGLGHPLLPLEKTVTNDFAMNKVGEIVIITGSNMAGKSTFLRTLGINLCLAYAGGPVSASFFSATLFRIFTCIKISDSVTEGYSYFYVEVRRLRALLDQLARSDEHMPIFFLIDEIFRGTNNRERRIGSEAYIEALVNKNCLGLLSTHDLELVRLADLLPDVLNYHFKEEVIDGQMVFDYILRPGPCPTTNALKIMQMEGLPVKAISQEKHL